MAGPSGPPARASVAQGGLLRGLTLARGDLDRGAEHRGDAAWFDAAWRDPSSRVLVLHRGRAVVEASPRPDTAGRADAAGPAGLPSRAALVLVPPAEALVHEGVRVLLAVEGRTPYLALLTADEVADEPGEGRWAGELRQVGAALDDRDAGLLVMAVALSNWHRAHPRCPRCGVATVPSQAGWSRTCPDDASEHFPRSDPAVIVLVTDEDDRALLGRRADWPEGWYSTLAGFVEAGESAEMAVVREIAEEAGVPLDPDRLHYLGSQPWPFPSSLMLGYRAWAVPGSGPGRPDGEEISELRWFTRDELAAGCADGRVRIPSAVSIARRLVEHWYGAELPGSWSRP